MSKETEYYGGEFVLKVLNQDVLEFAFVCFLGFMPLLIVHFGHRHPRLPLKRTSEQLLTVRLDEAVPQFRQRVVAGIGLASWRLAVIKTSLLVLLTDWSANIVI